MKQDMNKRWYIERRAELLVKMALAELFPNPVVKASDPISHVDYVLGIRRGETSKVVSIELKATELPVKDKYTFRATVNGFRRMTNPSEHVLIMVANVKEDRLYYGWGKDLQAKGTGPAGSIGCILPVKELTRDRYNEVRDEIFKS